MSILSLFLTPQIDLQLLAPGCCRRASQVHSFPVPVGVRCGLLFKLRVFGSYDHWCYQKSSRSNLVYLLVERRIPSVVGDWASHELVVLPNGWINFAHRQGEKSQSARRDPRQFHFWTAAKWFALIAFQEIFEYFLRNDILESEIIITARFNLRFPVVLAAGIGTGRAEQIHSPIKGNF